MRHGIGRWAGFSVMGLLVLVPLALLVLMAGIAWGQFPLPIPSPSPFPVPGGGPIPSPSPAPAGTGRGIIGGRVRNTFGAGVYRARVEVRDADRAALPTSGLGRQVQTDQNGRFTFSGLPAGSYVVTAQCEDYTPANVRVQLRANERVQDLEVNMPDTPSSVMTCQY